MPKEVIIPQNAQPPIAPYSAGIRAEKTIYTSGCGPIDSAGKTVGPGDIRAQTKSVLDAIKGIVEAGGGTLSDVTFNQIFLKDLADYQAMNEVCMTFFPTDPRRGIAFAPISFVPTGWLRSLRLLTLTMPDLMAAVS